MNAPSPTPPSVPDDEDMQKSQLLELVYANLLPLLVVNSLAGLGVSYILWQEGLSWVWFWCGGMLLLNGLRLVGLQRFYAAPASLRTSGAQRRFWQNMFTLGLLLPATMWAGLVWVGVDISVHAQYLLLVVVSASAGGATGVMAPLKTEGRAYILCLLLPAFVRLVVHDHPQPIMAGLGFVFMCVLLISHSKNNRVLRDSLRLRAQNSHLIEGLTERNHAIEDLNANLEAKVHERTEALKQIAHRDPLTGLLNRRGLMEWMNGRLKGESTPACALFLDLDRFKQINDGLGHEAGDHVLQLMAQRLSDALPSWAMIGRWGGDEFVVITAPETGYKASDEMVLAHSLIEALEQPFETHAKTLSLGVSIGTSRFPEDACTPKELIHAADLAAAEVKRTGRGQVIAYEETFGEVQRRHFDLNRALGLAMANDELKLAYQPIIEASSGEIAAFEVLLRWQHPQLGLISPDVFIPLAEDSDRICEIGDWVLKRACEAAAGWGHGSKPNPRVAVNVSVRQLLSEGFAERVALTLAQTGLTPDRLDLEVTESLFDEESQARSLGCVKALRALGVGVHIDDFGTGFSSLSRLHQFPVTAIKIDKSFVAQLHAQGHIIIESTLMIARRFGLKVVAEGVETLEQAQELKAMGGDYFQGYYFARPQFEPLMKTYPPIWMKVDKKSA